MSFFNLEVLKGKPIKFIKIMPHLIFLKTYVLGTKKIEKQKKKKLIWTYENMVKF